MKASKYFSAGKLIAVLVLLFAANSCKKDLDGLEPASFPAIGEVFIDGFSAGLKYAAFGGSDVRGFDVVNDEVYDGDAAMRFAVPDVGDPAGSYVGGTFYVEGGRNLSGFDALTFWMKASRSATIDVIGFGNDLDQNKYVAVLADVAVNTNWKQYILPIPDPSVLTQEKGLFFYSEGPENGQGYTFWIDEVRFEKLGTLGQYRPGIQDYEDEVVQAETGQTVAVEGLVQTVNLADGSDVKVYAAPAYFEFSSSNTSVATVNIKGEAMVLDAGTAVITATLAGIDATGSLTIESTGEPVLPGTPAPEPTRNEDSVISLWSNVYDDVPVDTWDTNWEFSTTETDFVQVGGDDIIRYRNLNFVGIEFASQTIDISEMTHFHLDIWTPDGTDLPAEFRVKLVDFGGNNVFGGGDDTEGEIVVTSPVLQTMEWVSIDVPLSAFGGLTGRENLAQMVLSGSLPNVFVGNVYFYLAGASGPTGPDMAAPTPTNDPMDVISVYSDAYTDIPRNLNPDWGQSTAFSEVLIEGNNTIRLGGLTYQGIEFGSNQDLSGMTHLHIDFWSDNATAFNVYLISPGPGNEKAAALSVPTSGWASADIELTAFTPNVDLSDVFQMKFDGTGDIYIDNIYFYTSGGGAEPSLPFDFEDGANDWIPFDGGPTTANIANPDMTGNASARVLEFRRVVGAAWYSGFIFDENQRTSPLVDLADGTEFTMKMWSPNAGIDVRFRLEGGVGVPDLEIIQPIGSANQWVTMSFDFTSQATAGQYTKIAIFPDWDPGNQTSETVQSIYYFDDLEQDFPAAAEPSLPFTFEDGANNWIPFDGGPTTANIANPDMTGNASARVLEFRRVVGAAWYSGFIFDEAQRTSPLVDLADGTVFTMKIWSPNAGIDVRFRLEGGVGVPDYEVIQPVNSANQWITLTFDFAAQATSGQYTKIAIFPDWDPGNQTAETVQSIYYFDDIVQQ